ncbi:MAG: transcriptional regulator [Cellulosilyticaceae bacterium]
MNPLLIPYVKIVEFLGTVLGPDYEIVLQDPTNKLHSIIAIYNGHITGRSIGSPLSDLGLKIITERSYHHADYQVNYNGLSKDNKLLRSSTFFIKDDDGLIGLLCISFDSSKYLSLSKDILRLCNPDRMVNENYNFSPTPSSLTISENFTGSISELTVSVLKECFPNMYVDPSRLNKDEKMYIVECLYNKGVFLVKGAISQVASLLYCSDATIYRYLNKISKQK